MKRVLAAVVAIALIAGGFYANSQRTDPERGREPLQLWCVTDAASVCEALASDRVVVTIATPVEMESTLTAATGPAPINAVVSSPAWLKLLDDKSKLKISSSLASAPIVVATKSGVSTCTDLPCLIAPAARAALPVPKSLSASIVAAGGIGDKTEDQLNSAVLEHLRAGGTASAGLESMTALVSAGLLSAVVTIEPTTNGVAGVTVRPVSPSAVLELDIGWIDEDPRLDDLATRLAKEFRAQGWDSPNDTTVGPDSNATIDAYRILNP